MGTYSIGGKKERIKRIEQEKMREEKFQEEMKHRQEKSPPKQEVQFNVKSVQEKNLQIYELLEMEKRRRQHMSPIRWNFRAKDIRDEEDDY